MQRRNIGFISFRIAGTDGVSLETDKWAIVFERMGHNIFYCGGELDSPEERSLLLPKAHFNHPEVQEIQSQLFVTDARSRAVTSRIHELRDELKRGIYDFIRRYAIDLLVPENTLSIPLNIPLGLAITEVIAETSIPTIGHHHDFTWERKRFMLNGISDYLRSAFPPRLHSISHVVINSTARNQLALRSGANSHLVPNVMDYDHPPAGVDNYNADVRDALGIAADETLVLQPTRVVQRKGIEHAIELVRRLDMGDKAVMVISHASGDEGLSYEGRVRSYAELLGVRALFVEEIISDRRGTTPDGRKIYTLDDVYPHADLVTYPSLVEGFGNAFVEAVYHRKPIFVNNYPVFAYDIRPKGFRVALMEQFVTEEEIAEVKRLLTDAEYREETADHNYSVARTHYSYRVLQAHLAHILLEMFGIDDG